jgi:hypothetical protein
MHATLRWALALGLVLIVATGASATIDPAFDFTGHWTGYGQEDVKPQQAVTADLVQQVGTRLFAGTVAVEDDPPFTCDASGKQKSHHMKVKIRLACDNGGTLKLHATLDAVAQAMTGGYKRRGGRQTHTGTFTLTREPT